MVQTLPRVPEVPAVRQALEVQRVPALQRLLQVLALPQALEVRRVPALQQVPEVPLRLEPLFLSG
jgi:hypothetical protein